MMRILISVLMIFAAGAASAAPPSAADRAAFERLAADNDSAWTAKDWNRIVRQYAREPSLRVGPDTPTHVGRAAIERFFRASFARRPDGFRHVTRLDHIELIGSEMALADAHVRVERAREGGWQLVRGFNNVSLLVREAGEWRLHSVRAYPLPSETADQ